MSKKKLIRVEPIRALYSNSIYEVCLPSGVTFAFVGMSEKIKDGIKYKEQISKFVKCREQFCEIPRAWLHKTGTTGLFDPNTAQLDMERLRLLIAYNGNDNKKDAVFSAKRVINLLEEEAGWDKSVITTVKHTMFTKKSFNFWLLTGPEQWIRVPQMLSLITLIIRIGCTEGPFDVNNIEEVRTLFNSLSKGDNKPRDRVFLAEVRKHIVKLMKNIDKVFNKDQKRYYVDPHSEDGGWTGYGGINSLVKCSTGNEELHEDFRKYIINAE